MSPARVVRRRARAVIPHLAVLAVLAGCGGDADTRIVVPADGLHVSCLTKPDPGPCRAAKPAYYYDYRTDSCRAFRWGGCQGRVPFATLEACRSMCTGGR